MCTSLSVRVRPGGERLQIKLPRCYWIDLESVGCPGSTWKHRRAGGECLASRRTGRHGPSWRAPKTTPPVRRCKRRTGSNSSRRAILRSRCLTESRRVSRPTRATLPLPVIPIALVPAEGLPLRAPVRRCDDRRQDRLPTGAARRLVDGRVGVRRWDPPAGRRRLPEQRVRHERMPREVMLLQVDGNHHAWQVPLAHPAFALRIRADKI